MPNSAFVFIILIFAYTSYAIMPCIGQNSGTIYALESPSGNGLGLQEQSYFDGVFSPPVTIQAASNFSMGSLCTFSNGSFYMTGQNNGSPIVYSTPVPVIATSQLISLAGFATREARFSSFSEFNSMTHIPSGDNDCVVLSGANQAIVTCTHGNAILLDLDPGIAGVFGLDNGFELLVFYPNYTLGVDFRLAAQSIQNGVAFSPKTIPRCIMRTYTHTSGTAAVPLVGQVVQLKSSSDPNHVDLLLIDSKRNSSSELYRLGLDVNNHTLQTVRYDLPRSVDSTWHDISVTIDPETSGGNLTVYIVGTGANQHDLVTSVAPLSGLRPTTTTELPSSSTKTIVGAVVGAVIGMIFCVLAVIFLYRQNRRKKIQQHYLQEKPLIQAFDTEKKAMDDNVIRLDLSPRELEKLDPSSVRETAVLEGRYTLLPQNGPAATAGSDTSRSVPTREASSQDGRLHTIHYFSDAAVFLRCVRMTALAAAEAFPHIVKTQEAIRLTRRTAQGYRYLWITSPSLPELSLGHVMQYQPAVVHFEDMAFKAWTTYILLEALQDLHQRAHNVHLGLTPSCFHYVDADHVTAWQLAGFYQTCEKGSPLPRDLVLNAWSAPEITRHLTRRVRQQQSEADEATAQPSMDIWSLGCIILMLATGRRHLPRLNRPEEIAAACNEAAAVHESFGPLLRDMIQLDPSARKPASSLAVYWKGALNLVDDVKVVVL